MVKPTWEDATDISKEVLQALGDAIPRTQVLLHATYDDYISASALDEAIVALESGLMKMLEIRDRV